MGEENNSVIVKKKKREFMKTFLTKTGTIPARRTVGDERLLLYTFVIVKTKKVLTECSCVRRLPGSIGTKVEF